MKNAKNKALGKKVSQEPVQVSKEYYKGKYQHVGFYEGKNGRMTIKPMK